MKSTEAFALANRLEALVRYCNTFDKTRSDILAEICFVADDLHDYASRLDEAKYYDDMAYAMEKHDDAMTTFGV